MDRVTMVRASSLRRILKRGTRRASLRTSRYIRSRFSQLTKRRELVANSLGPNNRKNVDWEEH
jgi:hypothetical protein